MTAHLQLNKYYYYYYYYYVFRVSHIHRPIHPPLFDYVYLARISHCEVLHFGCLCLPANFSEVPKKQLLSHTLSLCSYGTDQLLRRPLIYVSAELSCTYAVIHI